MGRIIAKDRQTLLDVQIMACGTLDGVIDACALNGISLTDDLEDGQGVEVAALGNDKVVATYRNKGYNPATAVVVEESGVRYGGIGYMAIGVDFVVS